MQESRRGNSEEYGSLTGQKERRTIGRREYMKLSGGAIASVSTLLYGSDTTRAAGNGFGEGEYGNGPYGGGGPAVETAEPTSVDTSAATLNGKLTDLDGAEAANCYFEWRETGTTSWTQTVEQQLSSTGPFSTDITGLSNGTEYEYRALADASDGETATGTTMTLATDSPSTPPVIDLYSVSATTTTNSNTEITAEWEVSDTDGNLDNLVVMVTDDSGSIVAWDSTNVNGDTATGTDTFGIEQSDSGPFDVTLSVWDTDDESASKTKTVTE